MPARDNLRVFAGPSAYRQIRENGLSPEDVSAVFGASGAAKWLTIHGLDRAVFCEWLSDSTHEIDLFGTSVGAFKLAAAAQVNASGALLALSNAYINQNYQDKEPSRQVVVETNKILRAFLDERSIAEILASPRFNYHCGSVLCSGWLASDNLRTQKFAMVKAFLLSLAGRRFHKGIFERCIFYTGAAVNDFSGADEFVTRKVQLSADNFLPAMLSSGSIPVVMPGVVDIPGAPPGMYRDGGLLDYHALPSNIGNFREGLVLYPHFYRHLKEGWFDKFWAWRQAGAQQLDKTILIGPSEAYVASLPGQRIPDRNDFYRFKNNDEERIRRWTQVRDRGAELGEEFMHLVKSGEIAARVTRL